MRYLRFFRISHYKSAVLWYKTIQSVREGRMLDARKHFDAFRSISKLKNIHIAFEGKMLILERRSQEALLRFKCVIDNISSPKSEDEQYLVNYSKYYEALIEEGGAHSEYRLRALSGNPGSIIRRWLPLLDQELAD